VFRKDLSVTSSFDDSPIAATVIGAESPRFAVQICHGMAEHRRRYEPFMEHLASMGGVSIASDMRGHGETAAGEENYGYFGSEGTEAVLSDVRDVGDVLRQEYPDIPFILFVHSMGTLVARAYAAGADDSISALILSGEASANPAVGAGQLLASLIGLVRGDRYKSPLLYKMTVGQYDRAFSPVDGEYPEGLWLSQNEENRRTYKEDPACGFLFTVSGYKTLFSLMKRTYAPRYWNVRNRRMPVLFLSGAEDPVMAGERGFREAVRFMRDMGYRDVRAKLYPGMRHEILNETDREAVYADIDAFLEMLLSPKEAPDPAEMPKNGKDT